MNIHDISFIAPKLLYIRPSCPLISQSVCRAVARQIVPLLGVFLARHVICGVVISLELYQTLEIEIIMDLF